MRRIWKKEKLNLLNYFEKEKFSLSRVAEIYKVTERQLLDICRRLGINHLVEETTPWSDEEIDLVRKLYLEGKSISLIAKNIPSKTKEEVNYLCIEQGKEFNMVRGKKHPFRKYTKEDIDKIRDLVNDGYTRYEIGDMLGINPSVVLGLKRKYKIEKPSIQELHDKGIFYIGFDKKRVDTGLTKEKLLELLDEGKTRVEIANLFNLDSRLITTLATNLGRNDKKIETAREVKRKLILEITGKEATEKDLNRAFIDILTKEYVEGLLKRNGYCFAKCSENELNGIDPKCLYQAVEKFNITIPDEIREDIFLARESCHGYGASKLMPNSMGEYFTEKALENLGLKFGKQLFLNDAVPKDIRPLGVSIDYTVEYSEKKYYIEYNGKPHYEFSRQYHKNDINYFISQVKRDMWVKEYCEEHDIIYVEIPYTLFTVQEIEDVLREVIINGKDINTIIDFDPIYKKIQELGITIEA